MSIELHRTRYAAAAGLFALFAACAETPTSVPDAARPAFGETAAGFAVVPLQLRAGEGSGSRMWGNLTVFVGELAPPNPCGDALQLASIIVCGVIHNPAGELLGGGTLTLRTSPDAAPLELEFTAPPNPCLTFLVRAVAAPDLGTAGVTLPAVQIVFDAELGQIVSVAATPGPPNDPATRPDHSGGVNAPPNPCLIQFDSRVR